MITKQLFIFVVGTILIVWVSIPSLKNTKTHGFYRFFAWELILILFVINMRYWFIDPVGAGQIIAWALLVISLVLVIQAVQHFRKRGRIDRDRDDPSLVGIEKTTELVTSGVYHYIRHPFYCSLLCLAWGIFFKHITWLSIALVITASFYLYLTAKKEEQENIEYFGEDYLEYMQNTKMFIPYVF